MASITTGAKGCRTIQFVAGDGKRRSIRLGKVAMRQAEAVKLRVEALNASLISKCPLDGDTAAWVAGIGDDLAAKLAAVGLIPKRASALLGDFLADYIDAFGAAFKASEAYNFPCFPKTVPDLAQQLQKDPKGQPPNKYAVLTNVLDWATNVGYPGSATAAIDEVFNTFVIPTMFAKVARDELSAEEAAKAADQEVRRIFEKRA